MNLVFSRGLDLNFVEDIYCVTSASIIWMIDAEVTQYWRGYILCNLCIYHLLKGILGIGPAARNGHC